MRKKIKAFTLIETVVAIGTLALVLPLLFSIFFVILREQAKTVALKEAKTAGDNVLSQMKNTIKRYAEKVCTDANCTNEVCDPLSTDIYFQDPNKRWFKFYIDDSVNRIASASGQPGIVEETLYLTPNDVKITYDGGNPLLKCDLIGNNKVITIRFKAEYIPPASGVNKNEYSASMIYHTKVRLISH